MLGATVYMSLLGKNGLRRMAEINALRARAAFEKLQSCAQLEAVFSGPCFNEFVLRARDMRQLFAKCAANKIIPGNSLWGILYPELQDGLLICVTEMNEREEIERLVDSLAE